MITQALLAVSLALRVPAMPAAVPGNPDPFFAEDKIKHYFASFVVTSLAATGARAAGLSASESLAVGAGVGATAGVLKEIHDSGRGQFFSVRDLLWDLAGVGTGVALVDASR